MYITSPKRKNGSIVVLWLSHLIKNRIVIQSKEPRIIERYKEIAKKLLMSIKRVSLNCLNCQRRSV